MLLLLFVLFLGVFSSFKYNVNEQLTYKYIGSSYTKGSENSEGESVEISGLLKLVCLEKDEEEKMYKMSMVLEDVVLGNADDVDTRLFIDGEFGSWISFDMTFNGKIGGIYVDQEEEEEEEEDFMKIKYNALDALQTYYEKGGMNEPTKIEISGLNGVISSNINLGASNGDEEVVERTYSQDDFSSFSDPSIPDMMEEKIFHLTGKHEHTIENGVLKNIVIRHEHKVHSEEQSDDEEEVDPENDANGFIFGEGMIIIQLIERKTIQPSNQLLKQFNDIPTSLFKVGQRYAHNLANAKGIYDIENQIKESLDIILNLEASDLEDENMQSTRVYHSNRLIYLLKGNPELFDQLFISKIDFTFKNYHHYIVDSLFFILSEIGTSNSQDFLIQHGLHSSNSDHQVLSILASHSIDNPTENIFSSLLAIFSNVEMSRDVKNTALLVYGILLDTQKEKENEPSYIKKKINFPEIFEKKLLLLLDKIDEHTIDDIYAILYAIKNAKCKIKSSKIYAKLIDLDIDKIKQLANELFEGFKIDFPLTASDSDFPKSEGKKWSKTIGNNKYASATASAEYFIGTNFDCGHESFNYKALGELKADCKVFGKTKSLADAKIIYGKKGSEVIGNEIFLSLIGKTIYQKTLKTLTCKEEVKNLKHTQHVFSYSYTIMIGPVPVALGVDGDIVLSIDWGWKLCDADLYADIKIMPSFQFVVTGSAAISLAVVKGGAYIDVAFKIQLTPRAYIKGTLCTIGADITLDIIPFTFDFGLFYQRVGCSVKRRKHRLPKIRCGWKPKQKKKLVYLHFDKISKVLWKKEWKIK